MVTTYTLFLTGDSPYHWHDMPALSRDASLAVFDCDDDQGDGDGETA